MRPPLITSSRLKVFRRCRREEHFRYRLGRATPATAAMEFGTLIHKGLETWWTCRREPVGAQFDLDNAIAEMRRVPGVDPYDLAKAEALLIGYDARWGGERYEVLAVEVEFRAELPGALPFAAPQRLGGKLDVLVRDAAGRVFIVEHKTSSEDISTGSSYWARLRLDGQVSMYYLGAAALGYEVEGVIYDVLAKPGEKPLKATPEDQRKYTQPKSRVCAACKDKAPARASCKGCDGLGRIVTEPARLYSNQRLQDETPEEYRARVVAALAEDPERYFARAVVVRLEAERARHLAELQAEARELAAAAPLPNPDSCTRYGSTCSYFAVCTGERRIDEYPQLTNLHPELSEDL